MGNKVGIYVDTGNISIVLKRVSSSSVTSLHNADSIPLLIVKEPEGLQDIYLTGTLAKDFLDNNPDPDSDTCINIFSFPKKSDDKYYDKLFSLCVLFSDIKSLLIDNGLVSSDVFIFFTSKKGTNDEDPETVFTDMFNLVDWCWNPILDTAKVKDEKSDTPKEKDEIFDPLEKIINHFTIYLSTKYDRTSISFVPQESEDKKNKLTNGFNFLIEGAKKNEKRETLLQKTLLKEGSTLPAKSFYIVDHSFFDKLSCFYSIHLKGDSFILKEAKSIAGLDLESGCKGYIDGGLHSPIKISAMVDLSSTCTVEITYADGKDFKHKPVKEIKAENAENFDNKKVLISKKFTFKPANSFRRSLVKKRELSTVSINGRPPIIFNHKDTDEEVLSEDLKKIKEEALSLGLNKIMEDVFKKIMDKTHAEDLKKINEEDLKKTKEEDLKKFMEKTHAEDLKKTKEEDLKKIIEAVLNKIDLKETQNRLPIELSEINHLLDGLVRELKVKND